jgi:hypothetical protein
MAGRSRRSREHGQILPLFVFSLVAILALAALLFDGANSLVTRRRLQNVGDAAALAGANVLQTAGSIRTCSASSGPPPGPPRSDIVDAVVATVTQNWPGFPVGQITVSCPDGWSNQAVRVDLQLTTKAFFVAAIGRQPNNVATTSTALNGRLTGSSYSVVLLDPGNAGWPNGKQGCPAFLISGGPTVLFDGSVYVDSSCSAANGGAIGTNGNSATLTFAANTGLRVVGGYSPGPLTISPAPITGVQPLPDPLVDLEPIDYASMTVQSNSRLVLNNSTQVLQPGVYRGGIQLKNSSKALLRPGIYVLDGGGLDIGAQASFCSISAISIATDCNNFAADCPDLTCGALIFNRGTANGSGAMGPVTVGAGATLKLRAYDDRANGGQYAQYRNLLLWQDASPVPASNYAQPSVALNGGGSVDISGTVYAPSALVTMGGSSGGGGGGNVDLLIQFIAWDLAMSGNSAFHFFYTDADTARPTDYGLIR